MAYWDDITAALKGGKVKWQDDGYKYLGGDNQTTQTRNFSLNGQKYIAQRYDPTTIASGEGSNASNIGGAQVNPQYVYRNMGGAKEDYRGQMMGLYDDDFNKIGEREINITEGDSWKKALAAAAAMMGGSMLLAGGLGGAGAGAATGAGGAGGAGAGAVGSGAGFVGEGALSGIAGWDAALAGAPSWSAAGGMAGGAGAAAGGGGAGGAASGGVMNSLTSMLPNSLGGWAQLAAPLISGYMGSNAAKDASAAQLQAAREAAALQEPFRQGGMAGMNRLLDLYGLSKNKNAPGYGSAMKKFGMEDFNADPGYQFRQSEGEKAIDRAAAASGRFDSGRSAKDLMRFNQGLASDEYSRAYDRYGTDIARQINPLQALMGSGQSAANVIGDYKTQGGNAQAAGRVGSANAWNSAIGQGLSMYNQNQQNAQENALANRWLQSRGF